MSELVLVVIFEIAEQYPKKMIKEVVILIKKVVIFLYSVHLDSTDFFVQV